MKCLFLFSGKNKSISKSCLLKILLRVLSDNSEFDLLQNVIYRVIQ